MRPIIAVAVVLAATTALALGHGSSAPAETTASPTPSQPHQLRNGCEHLFTRTEFKHYASAVFKRRTITRRARRHVRLMIRCQGSDRFEQWAEHRMVKLRVRRYRRTHPWEWQRSQLSPGSRAMLNRLGGCETRGLPYPENYRIGPGHPRYNGHDGRYQYAMSTWHRAGGSGRANWASPAEQDVRTARFYPSHRTEWACSA
jgi:hypothetical protein